ncbi:MAG TPA: serine/threonine protein kinase [Polyangiaceae bacterium]|nr:serine/threonine protein kinase [Polyangiaceae bacterium]
MSQQRFIRCSHCNLPHEAESTHCPVTGKRIEQRSKPRRQQKPPPSEENYAWEHSLHPWSTAGFDAGLDPAQLEGFIGKLVEGKYRIEKLIGRGGMGAVFRAVNERIRKPVALKILYRGWDSGSESERRFMREARVASSLGHPNIVEVFDLGHLDDGKPFQVMELLEGQSLAQRIQTEGAIAQEDAVDISEQILSALEAAHERGVIHRDLKPENVYLVERRGVTIAKLLDFGVSKMISDQTMSLTMTGVVVGTPYYLSPEQARGDRDIDHRVDLWSMGVLMYESLTGVLPFNADDYEQLLRKILQSRPVPPSRFRPRLNPSLEAVVMRALSSDRDERPSSAGAMLDLLRQAKAAVQRAARAPMGHGAPVDLAQTIQEPLGLTPFDELSLTVDDPTEISDSFVSDHLNVRVLGEPSRSDDES